VTTRHTLARKRLTHGARIAELERDLDASQHLLHEIVIAAISREHGRDPASRVEYRAYYRALFHESVVAIAARSEASEWLAPDE
jgi:hypothetical protein